MRRAGAAAALAAGLLVSCGGGDAVACGPVERPQLQGGSHLIGEASPPVPYSSTPGTSGWHGSGAPRVGVFTEEDPLREPEIVTALEVAQVVAAYDPEALPPEQVRQLETLSRERFDGRLTVTPFTSDMGAPLTLNAWGIRQPCQRVDEGAVAEFVERYRDEAFRQGVTDDGAGEPGSGGGGAADRVGRGTSGGA